MGFFSDLTSSEGLTTTALTLPFAGPGAPLLGGIVGRSSRKESAAQAARDAQYQDLLSQYGPDALRAARESNLEAGGAQAEELFGVSRGELGSMSKGSLDRLSQRATQGLSPEQRQEVRAGARTAERGTQAALGQAGVRGPAAVSAVRQGRREAAFDEAKLSDTAKRQAEGDLESAIGKRQLGTEAVRSGQAQLGLAEQSLAGQLAVGGLPQPLPNQGILGKTLGPITVICTEVHRQGLLSDEMYEADKEYSSKLPKEVYVGYYCWAQYVAKGMRKSKILTNIVKPFALSWATEMAFKLGKSPKGSKLGKLISNIGEPICGFIGKVILWLREEDALI